MNRPLALLIEVRHRCKDKQMGLWKLLSRSVNSAVLAQVFSWEQYRFIQEWKLKCYQQPAEINPNVVEKRSTLWKTQYCGLEHQLYVQNWLLKGFVYMWWTKRKWKEVLCVEVSDSTPTSRHVAERSHSGPHKSAEEAGKWSRCTKTPTRWYPTHTTRTGPPGTYKTN